MIEPDRDAFLADEPEAPAAKLPRLRYDAEDGVNAGAIVRKYLQLKGEIADLEEQLQGMKPLMIDIINAEDGSKIEGFLGCNIGLQQRTFYAYSPDLEGMMERVKGLKREEEKNGEAQIKSTSVSVVVRRAGA